MNTVKAQMTTDQFINAFGDHEYVKKFSKEGVSYLLEEMSLFQSEKEKLNNEDLEWLDFFQDAEELTPLKLCKSYQHEMQERAYQIICMANIEVDDLSDDVTDRIEKFVELKTGDDAAALSLLNDVMPDLEASAKWIEATSGFFAEAKGFIELPNGSYITG